MVVRKVYTRHDDGSGSRWELWGGEDIIDGNLYSVAEMYLKANLQEDGSWKLIYRMGSDGLRLPQCVTDVYQNQKKMKSGVWEFADWVKKHRMHLIAIHERYCDV